MKIWLQVIIALLAPIVWELVLRNPILKLIRFLKRRYLWKRIFNFKGDFFISKSTILKPKLLTRESDNVVEREILSKFVDWNCLVDIPKAADMSSPNQNIIIIGSPRYNEFAESVQRFFSLDYEFVYDSYDPDPAKKVLKIISKYGVEYISSLDLKNSEDTKGIDYGILFITKLNNNKSLIWMGGIHGAGTIGVFKYLQNKTDKLLNSLPYRVNQGTSWLFRIHFNKAKKEKLDMIEDVVLLQVSKGCKPRDINKKAKALICDLGNVIFFFDRFRTYRAIGHFLKIPFTKIAKTIESTDIRQRYEIGELSDEDFYNEVMSLFVPTTEISFDLFSEFWGDIFWPNRNMINALRLLRKEAKLILLSNTNKLHFEKVKEHYKDIISLFEDRIILSYEEKVAKPNKRIFQEAIHLLTEGDISCKDCIYVDDRKEYIEVANELGLQGMIFYSYPQFIYYLRKHGLYIP